MILTPGYTRRSIIPELQKRTPKLVEVADSSRGRLARSVYEWLSGMKDLSIAELQNPVILDAWLTRTAHGSGIAADQHSVEESFSRIMNLGAHVGIGQLDRMAVQKSIATSMSFTMVNPRVVAWIKGYVLNLITAIGADTRSAIRRILAFAQQFGGHPYEQARQIRPLIGLTDRQTQAVLNYRAALESGSYRAALDRALRDGRYDSSLLRALRQSQQLKQSQIDRMVQRYAERQLKFRSELIARTESLRAANAGLLEAWQQAREQRLLSDRMREYWIVATDERTCPNCKQIPGLNPDGVTIGGMFNTPYGLITQPPAHPDCRCTMGLR